MTMSVRWKVASLIIAVIAVTQISQIASADIGDLTIETGCGEKRLSYTGVMKLEQQPYDAYVRLGKRGQSATVSGFSQQYGPSAIYGVCDHIGTVTASGDSWVKLGEVAQAQNGDLVIQVSSPILAGIPDANRPSVLLVPRVNPVCVPTDECRIKIGENEGYVRPVSTKLNQDSLKLAVVKDPTEDTVKQVRYYVGDELAYTNESLGDFNLRYVAFPGQKLLSIIEYSSGQQVVLEGKSSSTHADSISNFIFRLSQKYPKAFSFMTWAGAIVAIALLATLIVSLYERRQAWRERHGFIKQRGPSPLERVTYFVRGKNLGNAVKYGSVTVAALLAVVTLIVGVNQWAAQLITVDGRSMEKSYFTGDQVLVNKLPKTFADFNNGEYVPKRGDVVVVRANFGNMALDAADIEIPLIIKRVLALPGERVVVKDGTLTVFNKEYPGGFNPDEGSAWEASMTPDEPTESIDIQLATTELFLSGDNRPESIDSRFNGPLLTKEVVGVVTAKF